MRIHNYTSEFPHTSCYQSDEKNFSFSFRQNDITITNIEPDRENNRDYNIRKALSRRKRVPFD
jgi:hypothetical protein